MLAHPALPAELDGLRVLHLTDLHVRRARPGGDAGTRWGRLLHAARGAAADLVVYTGDYMDDPGHEPAALDALRQLAEACAAMRPALGQWGVFGNHDSPVLRAAAGRLGAVRWLNNELTGPLHDADGRAWPLRVLGLSWPEDPLAAMLAGAPVEPGQFVLALAHYPSAFVAAANVGASLVLAGHTHGGQVRPHARLAPHTSSDLPPSMAAGVLRLGGTLCATARGLGEGWMDGARINCPRQAPLYTLRRGAAPPIQDGEVRCVENW